MPSTCDEVDGQFRGLFSEKARRGNAAHDSAAARAAALAHLLTRSAQLSLICFPTDGQPETLALLMLRLSLHMVCSKVVLGGCVL